MAGHPSCFREIACCGAARRGADSGGGGQQVAFADPHEVVFGWLGLRLSRADRDALAERIMGLFAEYKDREPDAEGESFSLVAILHPDLNPPASS